MDQRTLIDLANRVHDAKTVEELRDATTGVLMAVIQINAELEQAKPGSCPRCGSVQRAYCATGCQPSLGQEPHGWHKIGTTAALLKWVEIH